MRRHSLPGLQRADVVPAYAVDLGQVVSRDESAVCHDFNEVLFGQFGFVAALAGLSAVAGYIFAVLFACSPAKIRDRVVARVAVEVTTLESRRTRSDESIENKMVNAVGLAFDVHPKVTGRLRERPQDALFAAGIAPAVDEALHSASVANLMTGTTANWSPLLSNARITHRLPPSWVDGHAARLLQQRGRHLIHSTIAVKSQCFAKAVA